MAHEMTQNSTDLHGFFYLAMRMAKKNPYAAAKTILQSCILHRLLFRAHTRTREPYYKKNDGNMPREDGQGTTKTSPPTPSASVCRKDTAGRAMGITTNSLDMMLNRMVARGQLQRQDKGRYMFNPRFFHLKL